MLEKIFKLSANKTDAKTEVLAGITTFMTMAYILATRTSCPQPAWIPELYSQLPHWQPSWERC